MKNICPNCQSNDTDTVEKSVKVDGVETFTYKIKCFTCGYVEKEQ